VLCDEHIRFDPSTILVCNAGARESRRARRTGTTVTLYDGEEANMDTDGGRWQTVCEQHSWIISHGRIRDARHFLGHPEDWCEGCQTEQLEVVS
jgi:hypothetical protein